MTTYVILAQYFKCSIISNMAIIYLSIPPLMDIWPVSSFLPLQTLMQRISVSKSLCVYEICHVLTSKMCTAGIRNNLLSNFGRRL